MHKSHKCKCTPDVFPSLYVTARCSNFDQTKHVSISSPQVVTVRVRLQIICFVLSKVNLALVLYGTYTVG